MGAMLRAAAAINWWSKAFARIVRWGLLVNALLITGNAIARKSFQVAALPSATSTCASGVG